MAFADSSVRDGDGNRWDIRSAPTAAGHPSTSSPRPRAAGADHAPGIVQQQQQHFLRNPFVPKSQKAKRLLGEKTPRWASLPVDPGVEGTDKLQGTEHDRVKQCWGCASPQKAKCCVQFSPGLPHRVLLLRGVIKGGRERRDLTAR